MNALVTGAGGFIGRYLMRELTQRGHAAKRFFLPDEDATEAHGLGLESVPLQTDLLPGSRAGTTM